MNFDSITIAPYMGKDSVIPFLKFKDKWAVILTHLMKVVMIFKGKTPLIIVKLFEKVLNISKEWGSDKNIMYVVRQLVMKNYLK